jgi:hypothetical protein
MRKVKNYNKVKNNWVYGYLAIALVALGGCSSHSTKTHTSSTYSISASEARALGALSGLKTQDFLSESNEQSTTVVTSSAKSLSTSTYLVDFTGIDSEVPLLNDDSVVRQADFFYASQEINSDLSFKLRTLSINLDESIITRALYVEHKRDNSIDWDNSFSYKIAARFYNLKGKRLNIEVNNDTSYTLTLQDDAQKLPYFQIGNVINSAYCTMGQDKDNDYIKIQFGSNCGVTIHAVDSDVDALYIYEASLEGASISFNLEEAISKINDDGTFSDDVERYNLPARPFYESRTRLKAGYFVLNMLTGEVKLLDLNSQPL